MLKKNSANRKRTYGGATTLPSKVKWVPFVLLSLSPQLSCSNDSESSPKAVVITAKAQTLGKAEVASLVAKARRTPTEMSMADSFKVHRPQPTLTDEQRLDVERQRGPSETKLATTEAAESVQPNLETEARIQRFIQERAKKGPEFAALPKEVAEAARQALKEKIYSESSGAK